MTSFRGDLNSCMPQITVLEISLTESPQLSNYHLSISMLFRLINNRGFAFALATAGILAVAAAPPPSTLSSSLNIPSSLNSSLSYNEFHCTQYLDWTLPSFHAHDCHDAIGLLINQIVTPDRRKFWEFVDRDAKPKYPEQWTTQRTPLRWRVSTCVVAVVMLDLFGPGQLPGGDPLHVTTNDVSNFVEIAAKAHQILDGCAIHQGLAGWTPAGESNLFPCGLDV